MKFMKRFLKEEEGQDLIEYTMLLGFAALFAVGIFTTINGDINNIWTAAGGALTAAAPAGGS